MLYSIFKNVRLENMLKYFKKLIFTPSIRYPENWKPAYIAMQLGFIAGGFGLLGRDFLIILTVENWHLIVFSELFFSSFIFVGFILHTMGFAQVGIIISCFAGIISATSFNFLLGWSTFFHLWYINLAILILAVPLKISIKTTFAIIFIGLYCIMFLHHH